jgi:glutamine---fructose-6-phosphate transaminase (isomerizing)
MCGIFGYLNYGTPRSRKFLSETLINGLHRLEYRGYDSAGFSVDDEEGRPEIFKVKGNVEALSKLAEEKAMDNPDHTYDNHVGIAHTRWSTHGKYSTSHSSFFPPAHSYSNCTGVPAIRNSHPHSSDAKNQFIVVHNGIISNYASIKTFLVSTSSPFPFCILYFLTSGADPEGIHRVDVRNRHRSYR